MTQNPFWPWVFPLICISPSTIRKDGGKQGGKKERKGRTEDGKEGGKEGWRNQNSKTFHDVHICFEIL